MSDLTDFLLASINGEEQAKPTETVNSSAGQKSGPKPPLAALKLTPATEKALLLAGIRSVEQLLHMSGADILSIPGIDVSEAAVITKRLNQIKTTDGDARRREGRRAIRPVQEPARLAIARTPPPEQPERGSERGTPLSKLNLPGGYLRVVERYGIQSVEELCSMTRAEMLKKLALTSTAGSVIERAVVRSGFRLGTKPSKASVAKPYGASSPLPNQGVPAPSPQHEELAKPAGPRKWMDRLLTSLSTAERHMLVARNGLDGGGTRTLAAASAEARVNPSRALRTELMAESRLRHSVVKARLAPLVALYAGIIQARGRACRSVELAEAVGYPLASDGYDPVAFTKFILPFCPGLRQVDADLWNTNQPAGPKSAQTAIVQSPG